MTLIEVQAPLEKAQEITVQHEPINYAEEAARYYQEAEAPDLNEHVKAAKISTADYLAKRALEVSGGDLDSRVQQYLGNEKPTSR